MSTCITWDGLAPHISGLPDTQTRGHRRSAMRVSPSWRVTIRLESGLHVSTAIDDLSFKAFRAALPERLEVGAEVQFFISEETNEHLDGQALKGEAVVSMRHTRGTVFEFQEFQENDFNRLCVVLRRFFDELPDQSE